ncbi:uncharacterized protein LOC112692511 [Sipha flava]|uniref:Uncharacterized protein LOC112692511 n=1 Tax=Sipha flava TaxID=143950 RepID=A0A8B8GKJ4_9HEMI|nr:uncharacterized protein LOC112692511 [Sipha flava]
MKKNKTSNEKNKTKKTGAQINTDVVKKKKLTSRQRKAITKIIEKKKKNLKRSEMLNELKNFELSTPSLSLMTSISQTQTSGLRNSLREKKKHLMKPVMDNDNSDEIRVDEEDVGIELAENEIA